MSGLVNSYLFFFFFFPFPHGGTSNSDKVDFLHSVTIYILLSLYPNATLKSSHFIFGTSSMVENDHIHDMVTNVANICMGFNPVGLIFSAPCCFPSPLLPLMNENFLLCSRSAHAHRHRNQKQNPPESHRPCMTNETAAP